MPEILFAKDPKLNFDKQTFLLFRYATEVSETRTELEAMKSSVLREKSKLDKLQAEIEESRKEVERSNLDSQMKDKQIAHLVKEAADLQNTLSYEKVSHQADLKGFGIEMR